MPKNIQLPTFILLLFVSVVAASRVAFGLGGSPMSTLSPIGAMALFGGAYFTEKWKGYLFPLLTLWISDVLLNRLVFFHEWQLFYDGSVWTYAAFAMMTFTGSLLKKINFRNVFAATLFITLIHWVVTDIGVWQSAYALYPKTGMGFVECLIAAIPYELNFLVGTLVYGTIMFGSAEYMIRRRSLQAQNA